MRFRKSIKIMKGVRLNFSKSGLSLTAGMRGASVNFGPKGTYLNTGIPGTGLYDRTRIGGSASVRSTSPGPKQSYIEMAITVGIDDNGAYFIKDQNGQLITDDSILRKIRRTEAYKQKISELEEKFINDKSDENLSFIEIYKLSPEIVKEEDIQRDLAEMKPRKYMKREYRGIEPDKEILEGELEAEAKEHIRSIMFWTLSRRRKEYVAEKLPELLGRKMMEYAQMKEAFIKNEGVLEIANNKTYLDEYEAQRKEVEAYISGPKEWTENKIDTFLGSITLPVDFSINYDYDSNSGQLKIDLDLPEIDDLPGTKAIALSSGKVKIKEKSQKELKEEYIRCVFGLAFFFASSLFNISTHISHILISGYTQRISKKTGNIEDEYIYSVVFNRIEISKVNFSNIDPILAIESFHHIKSISKAFEASAIKPWIDFAMNV